MQRQRALLLGAIEADGGVAPLDADAFSVLQYNSPLTVPWRRRNELAVVVARGVDAVAVVVVEADDDRLDAVDAQLDGEAADEGGLPR